MNKILTQNEQYEISGGAVKYGLIAAVIGIGAFIIGIVDGLVRPLKCYKRK